MKAALLALAALLSPPTAAQRLPDLDAELARIEPQLIGWRRDIHQHPELGNQETRTATLVAAHLRGLGLEVRTGVGRTGVIGILRGARPGRTVALRADMDALPVREATGLPFASTATASWAGATVPVMHACGHDAHTAILMGAATLLARRRATLSGNVLFVFQPAEEGVQQGEDGGAALMLKEGAFAPLKPDAILALHVEPGPPGQIQLRRGPFLSSASDLDIELEGRQTHAGRPWEGSDLVNLSADIVKALATIAARRVDVFGSPNVVSIGQMEVGARRNILPGKAVLRGTIRTFDLARRDQLKALIEASVTRLAESYGARATVRYRDTALVTGNDPALMDALLPALRSAATAGVDTQSPPRGAAEDFSFFQQQVPGLYYILGSTPNFTTMDAAPTNHSDRFDIDEAVLRVGVKAQVLTALAFLAR